MGWLRTAEWPWWQAGLMLGLLNAFAFIKDTLLRVGDFGKLTLPGLLGVNPWVVIVPLVALCGAALVWLDRRGP